MAAPAGLPRRGRVLHLGDPDPDQPQPQRPPRPPSRQPPPGGRHGCRDAPTPAAETLAVAEHRREAVRRALRALPLDQRAPLVLTTFGGYTPAETGSILGISESAAKVRAHRARRALADVLQEWR